MKRRLAQPDQEGKTVRECGPLAERLGAARNSRPPGIHAGGRAAHHLLHDEGSAALAAVSSQVAAVERGEAAGRPRALELTGTWLLSAAMAGAGLLAYAFHILAARTLTTSEYGQVAAFWAALFIVVVVLFRPLEQTTARSIADRLERGQEGWTVLRSVVHVYRLPPRRRGDCHRTRLEHGDSEAVRRLVLHDRDARRGHRGLRRAVRGPWSPRWACAGSTP